MPLPAATLRDCVVQNTDIVSTLTHYLNPDTPPDLLKVVLWTTDLLYNREYTLCTWYTLYIIQYVHYTWYTLYIMYSMYMSKTMILNLYWCYASDFI